MNVLHITPYYAPAWALGGVVRAVSELAAAQAARGDQVQVLTTDIADLNGGRIAVLEEMRDGVHVQRARNAFPLLRGRFNLSTPQGFGALLQARLPQADLIHLHEFRTLEALLTLRAKPAVPIILSPHGTLSQATGRGTLKRLWDRLFGRYTARHITGVTALTQAERAEVEAAWYAFGLDLPPVRVIPNGVGADVWAGLANPQLGADVAALRKRFGIGDVPIVLFLGRLHERKGIQYLIPAFGQAIQAGVAAHLLIVGADDGMLGAMQRLVEQDNLSAQVTFAGLLEGRERSAALAAAEIFALPAVGEGLSLAALEAAASGCALILTEGCNLPEAATHSAGMVVARHRDAIAAALRHLLESPTVRRQMGAAAQTWAKDAFQWQAIAEHMAQFYAECAILKRQ